MHAGIGAGSSNPAMLLNSRRYSSNTLSGSLSGNLIVDLTQLFRQDHEVGSTVRADDTRPDALRFPHSPRQSRATGKLSIFLKEE